VQKLSKRWIPKSTSVNRYSGQACEPGQSTLILHATTRQQYGVRNRA